MNVSELHPPLKNGGTPPLEAPPDPQRMLADWVESLVNVTVRGLVAALPRVPGALVLQMCCEAMGRMTGKIIHGQPDAVAKLRRECREAFLRGLRETPSQEDAPPSARQMTALRG